MAANNKKKPRQQNQANQIQNKDAGNSQKGKNKKSSTSSKKSSSSVCPWLIGIFVLLGAIAGVITYDTQTTGGGIFESKSVLL